MQREKKYYLYLIVLDVMYFKDDRKRNQIPTRNLIDSANYMKKLQRKTFQNAT